MSPVKAVPLETRFWPKVNKNGPLPIDRLDLDPCWTWVGGLTAYGYGTFFLRNEDGRKIFGMAHRVSYELLVGPIPEGLQIDHLCRNRSCVNPNHLEPVTSQMNTLRGDTIPAHNARKTHCKRGHEFTLLNTKIDHRGDRRCRVCDDLRDRARDRSKA